MSKTPGPPGPLILASASPRRRELLHSLDLDFTVRPAAVDETPAHGERPRDLVRRLAREKAEAGAEDGEWVLAADTIVVNGGEVLGKPADRNEARSMLERLQGRWHLVLTGVALKPPDGATLHAVESTRVLFAELTPEQLDWYAATGEPDDKAAPTPSRAWAPSSSPKSTATTPTSSACRCRPCGSCSKGRGAM